MSDHFDVVVIGGGIAGISAASILADDLNVCVLEMESHPGYHATGRSAAYFAPFYGNASVRALTRASESFYRHPDASFSDLPLLRERPGLFLATEDQIDSVEKQLEEIPSLIRWGSEEAVAAVPILKSGSISCALVDLSGGDLDVDAILQGYLRQFQRRGGTLVTSAPVHSLKRLGGRWYVQAGEATYSANIIVNAAGAWVDEVAALAGLPALGFSPLRRTAILVDYPDGVDARDWPLVVDIDEQFYFKPDAGQLLLSPANETHSLPCDARPDELEIAQAVDRICNITSLNVRKVNHSWSGLRTFSADRSFVVGYDPRLADFFWLAGQGGYGVQSAPGMAQLCADLIVGSDKVLNDAAVAACSEQLKPERFL